MSEAEQNNSGRVWLAAAVPVLLIGVFVVALSGDRDEPDPGCLPNIPVAPGGPGVDASTVWPIAAKVFSPFGQREDEFHKGADFAAPIGTEIVSATSGKVVAVGPASGFGNWIVIDTPTDTTATGGAQVISAVYGHMFDTGIKVSLGQYVTAGTPIAQVGNAGESSGPHLHFEIVPGGRLSGGTAIDPVGWLSEHAGPQPDTNAPDGGPAAPVLVAHSTSTLPPQTKGSEDHLQVDAIRLLRALAVTFPQITRFENWREADDIGEHPAGRAVDAMIPDYDTPGGQALGDQVVAYAHANAAAFGLVYTIWQRRYTPVDGTPNLMPETGDRTADHFDHVHLTVTGGGLPAPDLSLIQLSQPT
uniref:M23 family metallopeptidase n=1 Tax=Nocardia noduli TaxID=2815722 RepID=UPI001C2366D4